MRKMVFLLSLFLSVSTAEAAYLDLAWDANQEPELAGYRVYYGTSSGEYINFVDVGAATSYRLGNLLEDVTYYITLTAYDTAGNQSDYCAEVSGVGAPGGDSPVEVSAESRGGERGGCFINTVLFPARIAD